MANRAYASVWCHGLTEETLAVVFQKLLDTVPFSATAPGFASLVLRAVDPSHAPLLELDLRSHPATAEELIEVCGEQFRPDAALETHAHWDLWTCDLATGRWEQKPQRVDIVCRGEDYDDGSFAQDGHFCADVGFEHLFTGHAGLLAARRGDAAGPQHPAEAEFLQLMSQPEHLREYHQRTRENVHRLQDWARQMETAAPVERYLLWSEGEENFEARIDEILTLR
jgi:hypothetical protein